MKVLLFPCKEMMNCYHKFLRFKNKKQNFHNIKKIQKKLKMQQVFYLKVNINNQNLNFKISIIQ